VKKVQKKVSLRAKPKERRRYRCTTQHHRPPPLTDKRKAIAEKMSGNEINKSNDVLTQKLTE
jgi:hypothetical protein